MTWVVSFWAVGFAVFLAESSNWASWSSVLLAFLREVIRLSMRSTSLPRSLSFLIVFILYSTFVFNSFCYSGVSCIGLTPVLLPFKLLLLGLPSVFSTSDFWGAASMGSPSLSTLTLLYWASGCFLWYVIWFLNAFIVAFSIFFLRVSSYLYQGSSFKNAVLNVSPSPSGALTLIDDHLPTGAALAAAKL